VSSGAQIFRGHGTVKVSTPDCQTVIFEEQGVWTSSRNSNLSFRNVYRWYFEPESVSLGLAHLRHGWDRPVHLVDFIASAEGKWQSAAPHVCGADFYTAQVKYLDNELKLSWRIKGPTKRQQVDFSYY
jgi:hypothetical protein